MNARPLDVAVVGAGSGAHPGGAVTGAPGYLAARAVVEDMG